MYIYVGMYVEMNHKIIISSDKGKRRKKGNGGREGRGQESGTKDGGVRGWNEGPFCSVGERGYLRKHPTP